MKKGLNDLEKATLSLMALTRVIRADHTALKYGKLKSARTPEALRKALERLCDKGYSIASPAPDGPQLFRPSKEGCLKADAPPAYSRVLTTSLAFAALAVFCLAWDLAKFLFLKRSDLEQIIREGAAGVEPPKFNGQFLLRRVKNDDGQATLRLDYFLCEPRSAAALVKRTAVILGKLQESSVICELIEISLFGLTIVAPTAGASAAVKAHLNSKSFPFPIPIDVVVVEALCDVVANCV